MVHVKRVVLRIGHTISSHPAPGIPTQRALLVDTYLCTAQHCPDKREAHAL